MKISIHFLNKFRKFFIIVLMACIGFLGCNRDNSSSNSLDEYQLSLNSSENSTGTENEELFGQSIAHSSIAKINLSTGEAVTVGPLNFQTGMTGMNTSRGIVPGPNGIFFPRGTHFGVIRDSDTNEDYVVVVDVTTGEGIKIVETSRSINGRGVAFGPDGVTLYIIEVGGDLSTIDTISGEVILIGNTGYSSAAIDWDPEGVSFIAISLSSIVRIDPFDASATLIGSQGDLGFNGCTIARSKGGTWYSIKNSSLVTIDINTGTMLEEIGPLGPNGSGICGMAFAPDKPLVTDIQVPLDIKPCSCSNPVNTNSQGVLPVALAGTSGLDVNHIDISSIQILGISPLRTSMEDVTNPYDSINNPEDCSVAGPDNIMDLTLKFNTQEIIQALMTSLERELVDGEVLPIILSGNLKEEFGGIRITGEDIITIIHKKQKKN